MGPAAWRPPLGAVISAVVDEGLPFGVRDRHAPEAKGRQVDHGGRALVVERPRLIRGVDTQDELAGRDQYGIVRHRARLR